MSPVETGQMSAVETGQMTAAETSVWSQQKTSVLFQKKRSVLFQQNTPVLFQQKTFVLFQQKSCPVSTEHIFSVGRAEICPVPTIQIVEASDKQSGPKSPKWLEMVPEWSPGLENWPK